MDGVPSLSPLPLLDFALAFGLYNLLCLTIYAALRWFGEHFHNKRFCIFGSWALVGWGLVFAWFALRVGAIVASYAFWENGPAPYPTFYVVKVGAILLSTLAGGGLLIRHAAQKQCIWWHGVLFTALYFLLAQVAGFGLFAIRHEIGDLFHIVMNGYYVNFVFIPYEVRLGIMTVIPIFLWLYPLIVPIGEILARSLYRAYQQNKTGSFA